MKKIIYAILAVPVVAALVAGFAFYPTLFGANAVAASQQPAQLNNQALEQENDGVGEQEEEESGAEAEAEDEEEGSIDPNLVNQAKITASEAKGIASNHLSVQPSAVRSIELEIEGGRLIYSVELTKNTQTIEVEVDAVTGKVIDVEQDHD